MITLRKYSNDLDPNPLGVSLGFITGIGNTTGFFGVTVPSVLSGNRKSPFKRAFP